MKHGIYNVLMCTGSRLYGDIFLKVMVMIVTGVASLVS